ncbi:MAG: 1-deoxy-D-xylulose-5-phosphate reductoisomerase, partial [Clostridia bacterium]
YDAARIGHTMPCVLNGANEAAVSLFLHRKIRFLEIGDMIEQVMQSHTIVKNPALEDILEADRWAREKVLSLAGQ